MKKLEPRGKVVPGQSGEKGREHLFSYEGPWEATEIFSSSRDLTESHVCLGKR